MELRQHNFCSWLTPHRISVARVVQSLAKLLGISQHGSEAQPDLESWRRELAGNELIRFPGWFHGAKTLNEVRSGIRISLHPNGRYTSTGNGPQRGRWELELDPKGRPVLALSAAADDMMIGGRLRFDPNDPSAVYLNGKRYMRRFVRNHLGGA